MAEAIQAAMAAVDEQENNNVVPIPEPNRAKEIYARQKSLPTSRLERMVGELNSEIKGLEEEKRRNEAVIQSQLEKAKEEAASTCDLMRAGIHELNQERKETELRLSKQVESLREDLRAAETKASVKEREIIKLGQDQIAALNKIIAAKRSALGELKTIDQPAIAEG